MVIQSLNSSYTGYRTESIYGEGYRDLREVVKHEIFDLGNVDILEYNKITAEQLDAFIDSLYLRGYTECIWLCNSIEDLYNSYLSKDEYSLEDVENNPEGYGIDKITIQDPIIIADIGEEGKLIGYKE